MTKIVVNRCYGGFGLSPKAQERYLELVGKKCFFYKQTKYNFEAGYDEYTRIPIDKIESFCYYTVTEDLGETTRDIGGSRKSKHPDVFWHCGGIKRNDPMLIKVVEELGSDVASGCASKLEIVDIPDGIGYTIDDYDGIETVHESHRSW